jgi:shikimate dehydrogenase
LADSALSSAAHAPGEAHGSVLVGLIGEGIGASRTPRMHVEEGRRQGLAYDYRLIETGEGPPVRLDTLLNRLESEGYTGVNVTYPFKRAAIPHLHTLSRNAEALGSVNTVVFREGRRFGHNTDYWGFAESFRRGLPGVPRDSVLLIGAGGAGAAVAHALLDEGTGRLMILDPDAGAAERLAVALLARYGAGRAEVAPGAEAAREANGIVNASPVGMAKLPGTPVPPEVVEPRHWVADVVYFPLETPLLALARAKGCATLPGSGMAIFQAVRAFELFTGRPADVDAMRATFDSFDAGRGAA